MQFDVKLLQTASVQRVNISYIDMQFDVKLLLTASVQRVNIRHAVWSGLICY